jgi:hypothetical protein
MTWFCFCFGKQSANSREFAFPVNPFPEFLLAVLVPIHFHAKTPMKSHVRRNAHRLWREIFTHNA